MRIRSILISSTIMALAAAAPAEGRGAVALALAPRFPAVGPRQFYDGPCANEDCGVDRVNCRAVSKWCVRYPSISEPEGCTCSSL